MCRYIGNSVSNDPFGTGSDLCYIQNSVIMNHVIKKLRCILNTVISKHCVFALVRSFYLTLAVSHCGGHVLQHNKCYNMIVNLMSQQHQKWQASMQTV